MDKLQRLEEQEILLGLKRRQLQLDLEEFELKKQLALLRNDTQLQSLLSVKAGSKDDALVSAPAKQRIFIDLTIDELEDNIKAESEELLCSDTLKEALTSHGLSNRHKDHFHASESLNFTQLVELSPSGQHSTGELPDQQQMSHNLVVPAPADTTTTDDLTRLDDPAKSDEQSQSLCNAGDAVTITSTPGVDVTQDDSTTAAPRVILTMDTLQPDAQSDKPMDTEINIPSSPPESPIEIHPRKEWGQVLNPGVKRKAGRMGHLSNLETNSLEMKGIHTKDTEINGQDAAAMEATDAETTDAETTDAETTDSEAESSGAGDADCEDGQTEDDSTTHEPPENARKGKKLLRDDGTGIRWGTYVGQTPVLDKIQREKKIVLAEFCGFALIDLLDNRWSETEADEITSLWKEVHDPLQLLEFETVQGFELRLNMAAGSASFRVKSKVRETMEFFRSEWELCWNQCREKETQAERVNLARFWIQDVDNVLGVGSQGAQSKKRRR